MYVIFISGLLLGLVTAPFLGDFRRILRNFEFLLCGVGCVCAESVRTEVEGAFNHHRTLNSELKLLCSCLVMVIPTELTGVCSFWDICRCYFACSWYEIIFFAFMLVA